jgi:hypothetical protein
MIFMMAISTNYGMKQTANPVSAEPKLRTRIGTRALDKIELWCSSY